MEKFTKSKLLLQIIVASFVATLATASIVGATTIGTDISTGGTLAVTGVTTLGNNITVPAAYGLDTTGAGALNIGTSTATSIRIGDSGVTTTNAGALTVTGATTLSSTLGVTGLATFSNNITVPAAYGLDTTGAGALNIGTSTATSIRIGDTGVTTTFPGDVAITGTLSAGATTITGLVLNNKTLTLTDSITLNATSTTDGHIMIADATTGSWINKAVSGDITITKAGVTAIVANAVAGTDIALASEAAGDIMYANGTDWVRLASSTDANIMIIDANGWPSWATVSSDATIGATGVLTIAANAVAGTDIALASEAAGDIMYANGTDWVKLAKGTANQMLQINAGETAPEWVTFAASLGNTLAWTAAQKLDAGITVDTTNFTVNGTTGAVHTAGTFDVGGNATTTAAGVIMPTQQYTTNTGCTSATVGGLMFNASKQILCVCTGTTWKAATSTTAVDCF